MAQYVRQKGGIFLEQNQFNRLPMVQSECQGSHNPWCHPRAPLAWFLHFPAWDAAMRSGLSLPSRPAERARDFLLLLTSSFFPFRPAAAVAT